MPRVSSGHPVTFETVAGRTTAVVAAVQRGRAVPAATARPAAAKFATAKSAAAKPANAKPATAKPEAETANFATAKSATAETVRRVGSRSGGRGGRGRRAADVATREAATLGPEEVGAPKRACEERAVRSGKPAPSLLPPARVRTRAASGRKRAAAGKTSAADPMPAADGGPSKRPRRPTAASR